MEAKRVAPPRKFAAYKKSYGHDFFWDCEGILFTVFKERNTALLHKKRRGKLTRDKLQFVTAVWNKLTTLHKVQMWPPVTITYLGNSKITFVGAISLTMKR